MNPTPYSHVNSVPSGITAGSNAGWALGPVQLVKDLSLHFNDVGDFEVIEPDKAHIRTEEYDFLQQDLIHDWARRLDIRSIGMGELRDKYRAHRRSAVVT